MYLSFGTLTFVLIAALVVWFWHDSLRVRDAANSAAIAACERLGLQFLDGTVAFSRLRFVRDVGQMRLRRTYVFDYTSPSIERQQGFVILLGLVVEHVGFAANAAPQRRANAVGDPDPPRSTGHDAGAATGNVFNLDEWRRLPRSSELERHD